MIGIYGTAHQGSPQDTLLVPNDGPRHEVPNHQKATLSGPPFPSTAAGTPNKLSGPNHLDTVAARQGPLCGSEEAAHHHLVLSLWHDTHTGQVRVPRRCEAAWFGSGSLNGQPALPRPPRQPVYLTSTHACRHLWLAARHPHRVRCGMHYLACLPASPICTNLWADKRQVRRGLSEGVGLN